jgi:large subunit ribosomal protein L23
MSLTMILRPRVSEKAYGLSKATRTYVFDVPSNANKLTVAEAIIAQFKVEIDTVNIAVIKGKPKKTYRKGSRPTAGRRSNIKKAYVTLKEGQALPIFAAVEEAEAAAEKDAKKDKKEKK